MRQRRRIPYTASSSRRSCRSSSEGSTVLSSRTARRVVQLSCAQRVSGVVQPRCRPAQTGSGKTYSMVGGGKYRDRGAIPRAIHAIFGALAEQAAAAAAAAASHGGDAGSSALYVSYCEIYEEKVFDLLDRSAADRPIELWPRVQVRARWCECGAASRAYATAAAAAAAGARGRGRRAAPRAALLCRAHGGGRAQPPLPRERPQTGAGRGEQGGKRGPLSTPLPPAPLPQTAETPMNHASSRSHCIFSLVLEARAPGSDVVRVSKLHFVDLAGAGGEADWRGAQVSLLPSPPLAQARSGSSRRGSGQTSSRQPLLLRHSAPPQRARPAGARPPSRAPPRE